MKCQQNLRSRLRIFSFYLGNLNSISQLTTIGDKPNRKISTITCTSTSLSHGSPTRRENHATHPHHVTRCPSPDCSLRHRLYRSITRKTKQRTGQRNDDKINTDPQTGRSSPDLSRYTRDDLPPQSPRDTDSTRSPTSQAPYPSSPALTPSVLYSKFAGKSRRRWPGFGRRSWSRQKVWGLRW